MKKWIKFCCLFLILAMGLAVVAPTISAYAAERGNTLPYLNEAQQKRMNNVEQKQVNQIITEIQQETKVNRVKQENAPKKEGRAVGSLFTKLAKKLGKGDVKYTLPKKIYSKLPGFVKNRISQSAFVGGWNTYILMGPADEVKDKVSSWLKKRGVWGWVANSAGYIAQGVVWAIL